MDGSAVGRYTPWVSPLTCIVKGPQQSEMDRLEEGSMQPSSGNSLGPYYQVASIIKVSTGARSLGVSAQDSASFPGKPMYRYSAILGGGTPPSALVRPHPLAPIALSSSPRKGAACMHGPNPGLILHTVPAPCTADQRQSRCAHQFPNAPGLAWLGRAPRSSHVLARVLG